MPRPAKLSDHTAGNVELAEAVRDLTGNGYRGLSVALIEDGDVRFAGVGTTGGPDDDPVDETTAYELGSITKGMTGMLLADSGLDPETSVANLIRCFESQRLSAVPSFRVGGVRDGVTEA